jgi:hypothetical protein
MKLKMHWVPFPRIWKKNCMQRFKKIFVFIFFGIFEHIHFVNKFVLHMFNSIDILGEKINGKYLLLKNILLHNISKCVYQKKWKETCMEKWQVAFYSVFLYHTKPFCVIVFHPFHMDAFYILRKIFYHWRMVVRWTFQNWMFGMTSKKVVWASEIVLVKSHLWVKMKKKMRIKQHVHVVNTMASTSLCKCYDIETCEM